jgi:hypothetical protein
MLQPVDTLQDRITPRQGGFQWLRMPAQALSLRSNMCLEFALASRQFQQFVVHSGF